MILNTILPKVTLVIVIVQSALSGTQRHKSSLDGRQAIESNNGDMSKQYARIYARGNALIRKFYTCLEYVKYTLFKSYMYFIIYMSAVVLP